MNFRIFIGQFIDRPTFTKTTTDRIFIHGFDLKDYYCCYFHYNFFSAFFNFVLILPKIPVFAVKNFNLLLRKQDYLYNKMVCRVSCFKIYIYMQIFLYWTKKKSFFSLY